MSEAGSNGWGFPVLKADGTSGGEGVRMVAHGCRSAACFSKVTGAAAFGASAQASPVFDQDDTLVTARATAAASGRQRSGLRGRARSHQHHRLLEGNVLAGLHFEVLRKGHAAGHATVVRLIENAEISAPPKRSSGEWAYPACADSISCWKQIPGMPTSSRSIPGQRRLDTRAGCGARSSCSIIWRGNREAIRVAPAVTENRTIALFPHEWARDPQSEFLRTGYHDVPWDTPELVHACIRRSRKQSRGIRPRRSKPRGGCGPGSSDKASRREKRMLEGIPAA
jgi:hypothetical protein